MRKHFHILGLAATSLVLGVLLWSWQQSGKNEFQSLEAQAATVLPQPREVPAFSLTDQNGQAFGPDQLQKKWSLLFFGFTRCPDICPNTLGLLHAVNAALKQEGKAESLQVVFVSVDPKFDKPDTLKNYVEYFDPGFVAVTGPEPELRKLTDALYVPYAYVQTGAADDYTVEHSGALVLMNPQGRAAAYFSPPLKLHPIVNDLRGLVKS